MNDLRTASQQAKIDEIAVEQWKLRMVFYDENGEPSMSRRPEPDEIRAALAQQAEPAQEPVATVTECEACFTPDVCQLRGTCDYYTASQMRIAAPPQQQAELNAEYERGFIDGMQKQAQSSVDRAVNRMAQEQAEPVEPHRWEGDHNIESPLNACMHKHYCMTLKQAPPQRKPLTDEEIVRIWRDGGWAGRPSIGLIRAVERAHNITDPQIADHLARHGIPMPGDPK